MLEEEPRRARVRRARVAVLAAALAVGLVVALTVAGSAAGDASVSILREPADGPARAGVPTTFTWLLLDGDGKPSVHHDAVFAIRHDGTTLLETTAETGHDYDGIDPYTVVFPRAGPYEAHVAVMDGDGGVLAEETVAGEVLPAPNRTAPAFLEAPGSVVAGEEVSFSYGLGSPEDPVPGTDLRLKIHRAEDGFQEVELDTSAADGRHQVTYRFDEPGTYEVRVTGAGTGGDATTVATTTTSIEVSRAPSPPDEGPPTRRPLENTVDEGEAGDAYDLYGTYDPYTSIGPHGRLRLGAVALDPGTGRPAEDVDYAATLTAPDGTTRLEVDDLREGDGILVVTVSPSTVGDHVLEVRAGKGDWSGSVDLRFSVHPPAGALGAGPQFTALAGPSEVEAGTPAAFAFEVADAAGTPLPHSEVDFVARTGEGVLVAEGKLHNHEDGRFPVNVTFPAGGKATLTGSPETLQPAPTPYYYGPEPGTRPAFAVDVAPGEALDRAAGEAGAGVAGGDDGLEAPLGPAAALAGLAVAAAARRRG